MLGRFNIKSQHHIKCSEVFVEETWELLTVEDEHSRARLGKQPGKGSGQSVPDRKFDFRFRLIAFFSPCLAGKSKGKGKDREKACHEISLLSTLMIWDTFAFEEVAFHRFNLELGWEVSSARLAPNVWIYSFYLELNLIQGWWTLDLESDLWFLQGPLRLDLEWNGTMSSFMWQRLSEPT